MKKHIGKQKNKKTIGDEALAFHQKYRGKIELRPKVRISKSVLKLAYTPGVGAVSSHLAKHTGETNKYTWRGNTVAIVSDGSAVLGLGNIGPEAALPVMEGKAYLFKALSGIDAVPLVLATQNVDEIVRTVTALAPSFGAINLEDIAAPRCFEIEDRLRDVLNIPVMHDDQKGTAVVVLAGIINALTVVRKKKDTVRVVVVGAGAAGSAVADMVLSFGVRDVFVVDRKGIIRTDDLDMHKRLLASRTNKEKRSGGIETAFAGADIAIGVSGPGIITASHIASMAEKPIVFAMANPIPEIMPDEATKAGAYIVATGRSDFPNQINNSLGFPGIFRGALDAQVKQFTPDMFVQAAHNLAKLVAKPTRGKIIPDPLDPRVVGAVSKAIRMHKQRAERA